MGIASDGLEAIDAAARLTPDVIVMDMRMPRLDGIAATRKILAAHHDTRVIMLSAYSDAAIIADAMAAGVSAFLLKGAPPNELRQAILDLSGSLSILNSPSG